MDVGRGYCGHSLQSKSGHPLGPSLATASLNSSPCRLDTFYSNCDPLRRVAAAGSPPPHHLCAALTRPVRLPCAGRTCVSTLIRTWVVGVGWCRCIICSCCSCMHCWIISDPLPGPHEWQSWTLGSMCARACELKSAALSCRVTGRSTCLRRRCPQRCLSQPLGSTLPAMACRCGAGQGSLSVSL